jgi:hypothetical protein
MRRRKVGARKNVPNVRDTSRTSYVYVKRMLKLRVVYAQWKERAFAE